MTAGEKTYTEYFDSTLTPDFTPEAATSAVESERPEDELF